MSTIQEEFDKLIAEQSELAKRFQAKAQELFKQTTKEFFDKNPAVTAIVWTQYTPFFNDGDTCEFSVNEPYFTNVKDLDDLSRWGEYEGENENEWSECSWGFDYEGTHKNKIFEGVDKAMIDKFSSLIQSSDMESVMKAMFDDHVRVIATRDGFDVEEHDHD